MLKNQNIENNYSKVSWKNDNEKKSYPNGKPLSMHKGKHKLPAYFLEWIEFVKVCPTCETKILCDFWDYQKVKKQVECPECKAVSDWPATARDAKDKTKFDFQTSLLNPKYEEHLKQRVAQSRKEGKEISDANMKEQSHTIKKVSGEASVSVSEEEMKKMEEIAEAMVSRYSIQPINLDAIGQIKHCFETQQIAKQKRFEEMVLEGYSQFKELSKYTKLAKRCVLKIYIDNFLTPTKFIKSRLLINKILKQRVGRILTQEDITKYLNEIGVYEESGSVRKNKMNKGNFSDEFDRAMEEIEANEKKNPSLHSQIMIALDRKNTKGLAKVKKPKE